MEGKNKNSIFSKKLTSIKQKFMMYVHAARLSAWMISGIMFMLGAWYSIDKFPFLPSIFVLISLGGLTSAGSWINNVYDRDLDKFAGRDEWGLNFFDYVHPKIMIMISFLVSVLCLVLLYLINSNVFLLGFLVIFLLFIYSVPPVRLKTKPPFDAIANSLEFGTLPFLMGWMLDGKQMTFESGMKAITIGLVVASFSILLSRHDIETDKKYGIKTSCTTLGQKGTIYASIILGFFSVLFSMIFFGIFSLLTLSLIITSPLILATLIKSSSKHMPILLGGSFLIWTGIVLFVMSISSKSTIPIIAFILIAISAIYILYVTISYE